MGMAQQKPLWAGSQESGFQACPDWALDKLLTDLGLGFHRCLRSGLRKT